MGINIGLDIGAISLKLAALGRPQDRPIWKLCAPRSPNFRMAELNGAPLALSDYRRIAGSPIPVHLRPVAGIPRNRPRRSRGRHPPHRVGQPQPFPRFWACSSRTNFKAIARTLGAYIRRCARFSKSAGKVEVTSAWRARAIVDYDRSGECAAGTGSSSTSRRCACSIPWKKWARCARRPVAPRASPGAARCSPRAT